MGCYMRADTRGLCWGDCEGKNVTRDISDDAGFLLGALSRSEERRVGKECRL